jgi:excisionase family DNA binding protein
MTPMVATTERMMLRPAEAADAIGVSRSKAYQLIAEGVIPSVRVGGSVRVPVAALQQWIDRQLTERLHDNALGRANGPRA